MAMFLVDRIQNVTQRLMMVRRDGGENYLKRKRMSIRSERGKSAERESEKKKGKEWV